MNMIVAVDEKWAIGKDGGLLTPLPEDMKFFRKTTMDSVVIMGRKTLFSFPNHKPLKNRVNIIITRTPEFKSEGAVIVRSIEEAAEEAEKYNKNIFVIGGGSVYCQMLKFCDTAYVTKIEKVFDGADTFIYNLDKMDEWEIVESSDIKEYNGTKFKFVTYKRRNRGV
ncbi:MAG: dihydrofolate reductase [Clostridia bacterium]|jgi:dihydrofolate reductase|nr:dihydrofolate reductase [Clostridia bacterium]MCI1999838.1 dihydrofolate reductase [Clostridia bacterium]MCI2014246.1 dihydrofolate reductase [Clostridia bacterium]